MNPNIFNRGLKFEDTSKNHTVLKTHLIKKLNFKIRLNSQSITNNLMENNRFGIKVQF